MRAPTFAAAAHHLARIGERFYSRGWVLGTSGNFSAVVARKPLQLAITASSLNKGALTAADIVRVDADGRVVRSDRRASAETLLHLEIVRRRDAGAVLHTHSVWSTLLSDLHGARAGFTIEGYEMLKGLDGIQTHQHAEWIPIVENDQDMTGLSARIGAVLDEYPSAHAILLRRHGLYTWGTTLVDAERHVEILEFLFEAVGRAATLAAREGELTHGADTNS